VDKGQLDGITTFIAVAQEKHFSAAAARLGVSPSAVSQSIRNLERRLGIALFGRNTRRVCLTEAGEHYFKRVLPAVRALELASDEIGTSGNRPAGLLRINVARAGYMTILQPVMQRFLERYPEISVELAIEASLADIVGRGFDAGIRFGNLVERDMVAVRVGPPIVVTILASPGYLARRGTPAHPEELMRHDCIRLRHVSSGQIERWRFARGDETLAMDVSGRLVVNDSATLVQSALDGLGVAYMINGYIERFVANGHLVRLLPEWSPSLPGFELCYADRHHVAPKLRALIDFLREETAPNTDLVVTPLVT
jgi:DNA-binding transcriptional LysR family regulator